MQSILMLHVLQMYKNISIFSGICPPAGPNLPSFLRLLLTGERERENRAIHEGHFFLQEIRSYRLVRQIGEELVEYAPKQDDEDKLISHHIHSFIHSFIHTACASYCWCACVCPHLCETRDSCMAVDTSG